MWIASTVGFFSIVNKPAPDFQVRAREKKDLFNLLDHMDRQDITVIETPDGDYRYRIEINKMELASVMAALMGTIRYTNFKNAVAQEPTQRAKCGPYSKIWSVMGEVQPGGPYASSRLNRGLEEFGRYDDSNPDPVYAYTEEEFARLARTPMTWKHFEPVSQHLVHPSAKTGKAICGAWPDNGQWWSFLRARTKCPECLALMKGMGRDIE